MTTLNINRGGSGHEITGPAPRTTFSGSLDRYVESKWVQGTSTAAELAEALADFDIDGLQQHRITLLMAVAELSASAGYPWTWGPEDPVVALFRAVVRLSLTHPNLSSGFAKRLIIELRASSAA